MVKVHVDCLCAATGGDASLMLVSRRCQGIFKAFKGLHGPRLMLCEPWMAVVLPYILVYSLECSCTWHLEKKALQIVPGFPIACFGRADVASPDA